MYKTKWPHPRSSRHRRLPQHLDDFVANLPSSDSENVTDDDDYVPVDDGSTDEDLPEAGAKEELEDLLAKSKQWRVGEIAAWGEVGTHQDRIVELLAAVLDEHTGERLIIAVLDLRELDEEDLTPATDMEDEDDIERYSIEFRFPYTPRSYAILDPQTAHPLDAKRIGRAGVYRFVHATARYIPIDKDTGKVQSMYANAVVKDNTADLWGILLNLSYTFESIRSGRKVTLRFTTPEILEPASREETVTPTPFRRAKSSSCPKRQSL